MVMSSVREGDVLRVLPGERIPVDGQILDGRCSVDESMLTGEAALVPKQQGSQVGRPSVHHSYPAPEQAIFCGISPSIPAAISMTTGCLQRVTLPSY